MVVDMLLCSLPIQGLETGFAADGNSALDRCDSGNNRLLTALTYLLSRIRIARVPYHAVLRRVVPCGVVPCRIVSCRVVCAASDPRQRLQRLRAATWMHFGQKAVVVYAVRPLAVAITAADMRCILVLPRPAAGLAPC